jgi:hypothetical protein
MNKINLKIFIPISVLPILGIVAMSIWGHLSSISLLIMVFLLAVSTSRIYESICKALKKEGH